MNHNHCSMTSRSSSSIIDELNESKTYTNSPPRYALGGTQPHPHTVTRRVPQLNFFAPAQILSKAVLSALNRSERKRLTNKHNRFQKRYR
mmetsp:Transcript_22154/g.32589  ORF Transcript_22154/g.32589 Transcript_22154/m.32589 type:complete len:90 (+) Transcript_22154:2-271(+)